MNEFTTIDIIERRLVVLFILCALGANMGVYSQDCTTIPVSLSNLQSCTNGQCLFSQVATLALPLGDSNEACLSFTSPDGSGNLLTLNISIIRSHFQWVADYVYYTDNIQVDGRGYCSCPGSISHDYVNCPTCLALPKFIDTVLCSTGVHNDGSCTLSAFGGGTWCSRVGLRGRNRFKIIHFQPIIKPSVTMSIQMSYIDGTNGANVTNPDTIVYGLEYDGTVTYFTDPSVPFNITVLSNTGVASFIPEFAVFDNHDTSNFYLLDNSIVNSLNEYNTDKIGWYKTDQKNKVSSSLGNEITTRLINCVNDEFSFNFPWSITNDILTNNKINLASTISPGAMLLDPDYRTTNLPNSNPDHVIDPYSTVINGWEIVGVDGWPTPIGWINDPFDKLAFSPQPFSNTFEIVVPNCTVHFTVISATSNGSVLTGYYPPNYPGVIKAYNIPFLNPYPNNVTGADDETDRDASGITLLYTADLYGKAQLDYPTAICTPMFTGDTNNLCDLNCVNPSFSAYQWPSFAPTQFTVINGTFHSDQLTESSLPNQSIMTTEMTSGVLNMIVTFNNMSIKFTDTTIKPRILSTNAQGADLSVQVQSLTVAGTCYASTVPNWLMVTQPVTVTVSPITLMFTMSVPAYYGNLSVIIQCYKNSATASVNTSFNQKINQTSQLSENSTGVGSAGFNWGSLGNPLDWFNGSDFGSGGNDSIWSTWDWFVWVIEVIGIIIACILIGIPLLRYIIVPLTCWGIKMLWKVFKKIGHHTKKLSKMSINVVAPGTFESENNASKYLKRE